MEKDASSESRSEHNLVDLSNSGDFRKGAQVVNTTGLPDGYVPPSASLTPPAEPPPAPSPSSGSDQSGNDD
jgi:hypothetical protein